MAGVDQSLHRLAEARLVLRSGVVLAEVCRLLGGSAVALRKLVQLLEADALEHLAPERRAIPADVQAGGWCERRPLSSRHCIQGLQR
eukprot:scaffold1586_cov116-Isochrysis_galbana.AAC.3